MTPRFSPAWIRSTAAAVVATTMAMTAPNAVGQGNDLSAAREMYASAAYEDALTLLDRLRSADHPPSESGVIEQYRAFCLLALGKSNDAEKAIEAVVTADPSYHPGDNEVSPRIRTAFADVRHRMLPVIVQQKYAQAKVEFDRKEYAAAAKDFSQVLVMLADPDLSAEAGRPPLSDLRVLAVGFEELSAKAVAPPPAPQTPVVLASAPAPSQPPQPPPAAPVVRRVWTIDDKAVVPPVPVSQTLPSFRGVTPVERVGRLEVLIDESGMVESAVITVSVNALYDKMALAAARTWRYAPATVNGTAVKFRKVVQITVRPTT
jgi:TonB family protein